MVIGLCRAFISIGLVCFIFSDRAIAADFEFRPFDRPENFVELESTSQGVSAVLGMWERWVGGEMTVSYVFLEKAPEELSSVLRYRTLPAYVGRKRFEMRRRIGADCVSETFQISVMSNSLKVTKALRKSNSQNVVSQSVPYFYSIETYEFKYLERPVGGALVEEASMRAVSTSTKRACTESEIFELINGR